MWSCRTRLAVRFAAILGWIVGTVVAFGPSEGFGHEGHAPLPTKGVTVAGKNILLSDKARKAIGLTTAKITFGDLRRTVEVNARVELPWSQQSMIASLVPGKIDKVLVHPGETVAADQELARLASMELESLQLAMLKAATEVELAERLVEQRTGLDEQGVIAGTSLLEAQSALAEKQIELRMAERKLLELGLDGKTLEQVHASDEPIRFVSIRSPIAGVITHADVRVGQVVGLTEHLYHVVDVSRAWIVGEVLESDVRHLNKGQAVSARFAAHPDKAFCGEIDHVRLRMDRRRRTQSVVMLVDNPDRVLRPGMFGRVSIAVEVAREAIVCPADAIIKSRSGNYVLVERSPGKYENRPIKLGLAKGEVVEAIDGIFPGDKVVVVGAYLLASLLGNEHKARIPDGQKPTLPESPSGAEHTIAVVDATIELPTERQAFATSRLQGRIRRVSVEPSQRVEEGDVLAEVDSLELRDVQLDLLQALSRLRLTEQSLARLEGLGDRGIAPKKRVWEIANERETLRHRISSLRRRLVFFGLTDEQIARLEQADLSEASVETDLLRSVPIRAPAGGWLVGFHVVTGQVVHPHDQLFEIHDLSKVWVKGYVFERDAARVTVGQPAQVTFAALPDLEASGKVVRIAPTMEEGERVLPVWVEVDNPGRLLKEGMLARVAVLAYAPTTDDKSGALAELRPTQSRN